MASTSPRAPAPQLLLVLSLLLAAAASASSLLPPTNAHPPRRWPAPAPPPAVKAREEGGSVSVGLISTLRETLDPWRAAVADCLDLLNLSSDELSWSMSTTSDDDYSPASAAKAGAGGRPVGTGDARSDLRSWLSGALGNQDTCKV
ncbi:unnamed protein product [Miscanthus lutarioriparius]|uniref:Pectinesterase inhibitor domain-containing protein n=1 Tax=Miscanthus lutarioriparius TaxID=422564 RepID=A0A811R5K8_9POAL|nr:unnamed protein product [Miscanthus lutarioriparius]